MGQIDADAFEAAKLLKRYCDMNYIASISNECNCPFCHEYANGGQRLYYCELSENIPAEWELII